MNNTDTERAELRVKALALYTPPFRHEHGYIFDAEGRMVADDSGENPGVASRVRGWGRIGYMKNAAALQDEVGAIIAGLLTEHWQAARRAPEQIHDLYIKLTDAMGYDSGKDGLEWSPEEWAEHLLAFYRRAPAAPVPQGWRDLAESALKVLTYKGDYRSKDRFNHKLATIAGLRSMLAADAPQPPEGGV